jgi:hypothetical protein
MLPPSLFVLVCFLHGCLNFRYFQVRYYHQATFLQFHLVSSILPQSPYFFHWYFLFRCSLYKYEFYEISYCTEKLKCDDIHCKKVLLDPQSTWHSPVFNILLQLYLIYFITCPICYIWVPREIRANFPVLNDLRGGNSKTTRISISAHKMHVASVCPKPCVACLLGIRGRTFEFGSSANCKKVGPKPSAAYYNE